MTEQSEAPVTEPDVAELADRVRAFLAAHPPASLARLDFLRARFDAAAQFRAESKSAGFEASFFSCPDDYTFAVPAGS